MTAASPSELPGFSRRVLQLQVFTMVWMTVEAVVSLGTAWSSHSPGSLGFRLRQLDRAAFGSRRVLALSFHAQRDTDGSDCGSLAFRAGGTRDADFRSEFTWIS